MEGIIVLIVLFSIVQKIAEKLKEYRENKTGEQIRRNPVEDIAYDHEQARQGQHTKSDNNTSYNPYDPFSNWEEILFPQQQQETTQNSIDLQYVEPVKITRPKKKEAREVPILEIHRETPNVNDRKKKLMMDQESLRQGVLWSEILGSPKSNPAWRQRYNLQRSKQRG
ncbi:hypothetical protein BHU72_11480 [Desulfuribacillus stibiiarsenatis]|uniref:Uncharacterized protein n=1 Tax=Desulfuribacillus stibiiarsenatis TaxID=1390249 RepID=A0A1E5L7N3_9FIRM|nr:hypothetical protein [Desulfuribacillus stibiiarsenatis]OEH86155.1 hypothetical protein BHU72_11480 [Desulfuribacillus stibiiarsenatis]